MEHKYKVGDLVVVTKPREPENKGKIGKIINIDNSRRCITVRYMFNSNFKRIKNLRGMFEPERLEIYNGSEDSLNILSL